MCVTLVVHVRSELGCIRDTDKILVKNFNYPHSSPLITFLNLYKRFFFAVYLAIVDKKMKSYNGTDNEGRVVCLLSRKSYRLS